LDPIIGSPRFTFGEIYLWDGVGIVPVLIGLFAGAEIVSLFGRGTTVAASASRGPAAQAAPETRGHGEPVTLWQGVASAVRSWALIVRTSVIGVVVGVIPGVGGAVSGFLAYAHAKQTSRTPEKFGKGAVEGVIAAEAANDAKEGGSLLPTVAFGIPGTVGMAILLGALIMHGVPAGPTLMLQHADLVYVLVIGMTASKFIAPLVVWLLAGHATRLTALRPGLFTPLIAVTALVGAYTVQLQILDVLTTLVFGYVGYAMRRYGFSRVALIIALVLGDLVERSYYQTVRAFDSPWAILSRPISAVLVVLSVLVLVYAAVQAVRRSKVALPDEDGEELLSTRRQPGRIVFDLLQLAFAVTIVVSALALDGDRASMPLLIGVPTVIALTLQLLLDAAPQVAVAARTATGRLFGSHRHAADTGPVLDVAPVPVSDGDGGARPVDGIGLSTAVLTGVRKQTAEAEVAEEQEESYTNRQILQRQAAFAVWSVGFVVVGAVAGFVLAIPLSLMFFLVVLARETWLRSAVIASVTALALWGLFDAMLGVPLSG
jgi:hypothetical protein